MVKIYPSPFTCIIILSAELAHRLFCNSPDTLRFI